MHLLSLKLLIHSTTANRAAEENVSTFLRVLQRPLNLTMRPSSFELLKMNKRKKTQKKTKAISAKTSGIRFFENAGSYERFGPGTENVQCFRCCACSFRFVDYPGSHVLCPCCGSLYVRWESFRWSDEIGKLWKRDGA